MTQNSSIKNQVRARMAETGEPYSVALRAVKTPKSPTLGAVVCNPDDARRKELAALILFMTRIEAMTRSGMAEPTSVCASFDAIENDDLRRKLQSTYDNLSAVGKGFNLNRLFAVEEVFPAYFVKLYRENRDRGQTNEALRSMIDIWKTEFELL